MRRLKFYIQSFLIDRRIWLGIFGVVLVAMMISYNDFYVLSYREQKPAAAYYYFLAFNQTVAMATYLIVASQSSITLFCEDYGQNRLAFILPRSGYWRYALGLVSRVVIRVYLIGVLSGGLLLAYFLLGAAPVSGPMTFGSAIVDMSNSWLFVDGHYISFYLLMISNIGLMLSFYALLGVWLTVYYPNKMTSYMIPIFWWFIFTEFRLEQVVPFFLFPPSVFSTGNTMIEAMNYYGFGSQAVRYGIGMIYPYFYLVIISLLIAWAIKVAIQNRWQFYEKEGIV